MVITADFFNIDEDNLSFLLDLIAGEPQRLFKCSKQNAKINRQEIIIQAEFDVQRMSKVADILKTRRMTCRKLAILWIYSHRQSKRGE